MASRVTVISGDLANPQTIEILERIGQPYLLKPFKTHELLAHIEKNAGGGQA
jgi:DNA-binding response OmpR family regulator